MMATDEIIITEQSQACIFNNVISSADKNMNDSLEKAIFGRKHLKRRSSLFFKNTEVNDVTDNNQLNSNAHNSSDRNAFEEEVITSKNKRRSSMCFRKSIYRTRSKAAAKEYKIIHEPPPVTLKPILLSATQNAARRITLKAKGWNKHRRVHFHSVPNVHEISPRSGKIPGVVKMPDSPPIVKEFVNVSLEDASDCTKHGLPIAQALILHDTITDTSQNETIRFLPAISETFHYHSEKGKFYKEECLGKKNSETNGDAEEECLEEKNAEISRDAVDILVGEFEQREISSHINAKRDVGQAAVSSLLERSAAIKGNRPNMEEAPVAWVRGDRLRSLSMEMKEDNNENKENLNIPNDKSIGSLQQCDVVSSSLQQDFNIRRSSLLAVPRAGPKEKVEKWLRNLPNQWDHEVGGEDLLISNQQGQIAGNIAMHSDNILIQKRLSNRQSFGGLPKKQGKKNECRRRSGLLQKAITELPTSNRRETIIVNEVKRSSCERDVEKMDDDVILIDDEKLNSVIGKPLTFCEKKVHVVSTGQMSTNKTETTVIKSSNSSNQFINGEMNSSAKDEKKRVWMDEMDFAPFPNVSNIGYTEIASVNYDLPCELRQQQYPKMLSCSNNTFQMLFRRKSVDEGKNFKQKVATADSHILARSRGSRRKRSKNERWKTLNEELQQNTWSEALRPMHTDELIIDSVTVRKLCDWISMWKERLQKSRNSKKNVKVNSRRKRRDSDSSDSFSSDEEEQLCNTAIIYGHCGSGKTSLVYAASKRYEMHVLEIASNEKRNGLQLKCKLQGATHSHKFPMSAMVNQMFRRNRKDEGIVVEDSIILVDDCDVIYDKHDDGFWPALRVLCKEAHTPVIIVCEDISLVRKQLGFEVSVFILPLIRPEIQTVSSHLQELCTALEISVSSDVCCALAEHYKGDLRACINQLQFYSGRDNSDSLKKLTKRLKTEEPIEFEALSRKCHLLSYNVVLRYDHSYEPGAVLSSIDREVEDLDVVQTDMHEAVKVTRSVLPAIEYFPVSDVILDYIPYLCIMNKASRAKMPTSRRAQHYFDELHGDSRIDFSGSLKNALTQFCLLNY